MKKILFLLLSFCIISLSEVSAQMQKGILQTEMNGFQWYKAFKSHKKTYKTKCEAYTLDGRKLFPNLKCINIIYIAADKNDEGRFIVYVRNKKRESKFEAYMYDTDGKYINTVKANFIRDSWKRVYKYGEYFTFSGDPLIYKNNGEYFMEGDDFEKKDGVYISYYKTSGRIGSVLFPNGNFIDFSTIKKWGKLFLVSGGLLYEKVGVYLETGEFLVKGGKAEIMDDRFCKIKTVDRTGIIDSNGKWIVPLGKWHEITLTKSGMCNKVFFIVGKDYRHKTIFNEEGIQLVPFDYESIKLEDVENNKICFIVELDSDLRIGDDGKGIIDEDGFFLLYPKYAIISYTNNTFYVLDSERNCGLMNSSGRWIVSLDKYKGYTDYCGYNKKTFYIVYNSSKNGPYGLVDELGNEILPVNYKSINCTDDNYIRFKLGDEIGIVNSDGKVIIPTWRGYKYISAYNNQKGLFNYCTDGYEGVCDGNGIELTRRQVKTPQNTASNNSSNKSYDSKSGVDSPTLTQVEVKPGLLYSGIYTQNGQGRSQTTGQYTNDIGESTWEVEIYEDRIVIGGSGASFEKFSGTTRVYDGVNFMGQSVTYYVDKNYNIRSVERFDGPYGSDWFEYSFRKGESTMPKYSNGNNNSDNYGGKFSTEKKKSKTNGDIRHECTLCHGQRTVVRESNTATYGRDERVYCSQCGRSFYRSAGHRHISCPQCKGKGWY